MKAQQAASVNEKAARLVERIDWTRPELAAVRRAENPAVAFVCHLARTQRPRFRFEYERKADILAFLRENYESWRRFDTATAERLAHMSVRDAQKPRATVNIAKLGRAWWATGEPKYGAAFERFYTRVPTGQMFNWGECNGAQGAAELDAWFLLLDCPGFTADGRMAFLDHLAAITDFAWDDATSQWTQCSLGPEGHNWYLHGMHVLPFFGILFPEFTRSAFFLRTGWSVVEEHLRGHYKADGGARETTLGYQVGSMQSMWDFYLIARRNGHPMSEGFADRLLRATKFLLRLMTPDGSVPVFGDTGHHPGSLTRLAATAAALTRDGECKWYAEYARRFQSGPKESPGAIPFCAFWPVGLTGAATYEQTRPRNPNHVSVLMGPTGYAAMRDSERPDAHYMAIAAADRGPIVTSHGHNEIFSFEVHARGVRFLGDEGYAPYGTSPGRLYDESTEAHNTLTIAGWEQVPPAGEWRWRERLSPCVRRWISEPTHDFFHGVHEGFYKYPEHETLHARKILFVKSTPQVTGYWLIFDWLESRVRNDYRIYFHGTVPATARGKAIVLGETRGPQMAVMPPTGDSIRLRQVLSAGLSAYIREKRLDPKRYPCFEYARRADSHCFVWLIALIRDRKMPAIRRLEVKVNGIEEDAHGATAVKVQFGRIRDFVCLSHKDFDATLEFGPCKAWGHLAFRRVGATGRAAMSFEHTMADGCCGR